MAQVMQTGIMEKMNALSGDARQKIGTTVRL